MDAGNPEKQKGEPQAPEMDFGFGGRDPRTNFKYPKERALQIPLAKTVSFGYFRSADSSSVTSCGGVSYGHPADRMGRWALPCGICPSGTRCPTGCRRRC